VHSFDASGYMLVATSTCHILFVCIMVGLTKAHHMLLHVAIFVNLMENPRFSRNLSTSWDKNEDDMELVFI
jgi:hypothetical protein